MQNIDSRHAFSFDIIKWAPNIIVLLCVKNLEVASLRVVN